MRRIRQPGPALAFRLSPREAKLFRQLLLLYPRVPSGHHRIGTGFKPGDEAQRLLDESLAEQRAAYKRRIREFLANPANFRADDQGAVLALRESDAEWLLQVLNDIRVGSWVRAGSPERLDGDWLTPKTVKDAWAMDMAGYFQMHLLEAR